MIGVRITLDWQVVTFTVVVSLVTGILFGLAPAFDVSRAGTGLRQNKTRSLVVIGEVALALVLLIAAAPLHSHVYRTARCRSRLRCAQCFDYANVAGRLAF